MHYIRFSGKLSSNASIQNILHDIIRMNPGGSLSNSIKKDAYLCKQSAPFPVHRKAANRATSV